MKRQIAEEGEGVRDRNQQKNKTFDSIDCMGTEQEVGRRGSLAAGRD